jgi:hypothetical protein
MMTPEQQLRALGSVILAKAGFKVGGNALAAKLGVSDSQLTDWLGGRATPPLRVILRAIDVLEPFEVPGAV